MTARINAEPLDLGPSWLSSAPDGTVVSRRRITSYTVTEIAEEYIGAVPEGRRRREYFDTRLVAEPDAPLLAPAARFWLVVERVAGRPGEAYSALAFRRPDAATAEQAFAARRAPASDSPTHPSSLKGAP